jgi:hypothetical protein
MNVRAVLLGSRAAIVQDLPLLLWRIMSSPRADARLGSRASRRRSEEMR